MWLKFEKRAIFPQIVDACSVLKNKQALNR